MGRHRFTGPALAFAENEHDGKGGDAGVDVHDGAAGEVEGAPLEQPAGGAEDPVGDGRVHQHQPQTEERGPAGELHAVGGGAGDEGGGDDGEHHLVAGEGDRGDGEGEVDVAGLDVTGEGEGGVTQVL